MGQPQPYRPSPVIGSLAPDAIALGRIVDPEDGIAERIRYGGDQHTLILGPNGKGKGTRILVPNLLSLEGLSLVVVDPKGELAAITAPYRRTLGPVVILNPFGVLTHLAGYEDLRSTGFNPLASLDPDAESFNADAALLAAALVEVDPKDPHWGLSARALVAAVLQFIAIEAKAEGKAPTMARLRELLSEAVEEPNALNDHRGKGIPQLALDMMAAASSPVGLRNKAGQFTEWNKEIQSVASVAKIQTEPFDDNQVAEDVAKVGFDFRELKRRPVTVYLILPPTQMERHSKWLRLVLTAAIQAVLRPREPGEPKTLFMLDEFFALGRLEIIRTVWALVRGYGVQMMPILQDLGQLKTLYPENWETFTGMAGAVASFATNDMTTAKWLSERAGETTRDVTTKSTSFTQGHNINQGSGGGGSSGESWSNSTSSNTSPTKTTLITPHTLMGLKAGFMLLSVDGLSPLVPTYAPPYYDIRTLNERARANPYYLGPRQ